MSKIEEMRKTIKDILDALEKKALDKPDYDTDPETDNFLEHFEPKTKHPLEPTAGMPPGKKQGEKVTPTGFKLKVVKEECLKFSKDGQWKIEKSNYGPKGMGLYDPNKNQERKANNTGETNPNIGRNANVKSYTTTGSAMTAANEGGDPVHRMLSQIKPGEMPTSEQYEKIKAAKTLRENLESKVKKPNAEEPKAKESTSEKPKTILRRKN